MVAASHDQALDEGFIMGAEVEQGQAPASSHDETR